MRLAMWNGAHTEEIRAELRLLAEVLDELRGRTPTEGARRRLFVVIDKKVYELYEGRLNLGLEKGNHLLCEASESHKSIEEAGRIWDELLLYGYTKKDVLVAIGGGIIGDMAGLAASCYKRGMRFIQVPTTLLAMVDSSIGAKTGLNFGSVKNSLGSYYAPEKRILSYDFLSTLPRIELLCGLAEMIKIAAVCDEGLFVLIENKGYGAALDRECIEKAMELKKDIVKKDPCEDGLRKILNFGHTIGHALEAYLLDKGEAEVKHGLAVAYGMAEELRLGLELGLTEEGAVHRLRRLIEACGFEMLRGPGLHELLTYLRNDKKNGGGGIRFALLRDIGRAEIVEIREEELMALGVGRLAHLGEGEVRGL